MKRRRGERAAPTATEAATAPRKRARPPAARATAARPRDREATKQALLGAAVEVFAQRGYDAATTREVAAKAGVNESLIQRYFGGKAGLLIAILADCGSAEKRGACQLPPARDEVGTEIRSFLEFHLRHAWENRDFMRVVMYRSIVDPAVAAEVGKRFSESRVPAVLERLRALRSAGRIGRGVDLSSLAHALSTLSFGIAFMDQVVFGVDRRRLRAIIASMARLLALGLESK